MQQVIARYDGAALYPEEPLDIEPDTRCSVTVEKLTEAEGKPGSAFTEILAMAQDLGIEDLSAQHDHYLYGLPKR